MSINKSTLTGKTSKEETLLVKRCRRGNSKAQRALYDRYSSKMLGVCFLYVYNRADAEDILQEGFIKVFTALEQFKFQGSLEGWIRRIMVNTALNFLKKNKRQRQQMEVDEVHLVAGESADEVLKQKDILKMMQYLPEGYRTVINLYAIDGYSHKEIGEKLNISEGTSRSQYSRGKKMLRQIQEKLDEINIPNSGGE